jgi:heme-degrading monooxygenase HmoA
VVEQSITVFRSRLRDDVPDDFAPLAAELEERARAFPGFVDFKEFTAVDGERLAVVTFASAAAEAAWRDDAQHRDAQQQGRDRFYSEYDIAVCSVLHRHTWPPREA